MRTLGISHIIQASSPLPEKGQIVSTVHWPTMGKSQSFAFLRSGAVEVPRMNMRGTTAISYSLAWRGRHMSKISTGDFLPLLLPLTFSCSLSLPKRRYDSKTMSQQFFRKEPDWWVFVSLSNSSQWTIHPLLLVRPAAWSSFLLSMKNKRYGGGKGKQRHLFMPISN